MTVPIAAPEVSEAAKQAVEDVLDSGMLADGEVVRRFEEEFAEYVGVEHAVATSSGTTALHTTFEAAGIEEGDAVVTTPFSFVSTANSIAHAGAEPVFADIREETYNLDPEAVERILEKRDDVAAVMPVHLYGLPAEMDEFGRIADEHDVLLFEDAAQAHGAEFDGERVGSIGDAGAFSFYPTKNMTTGEGGMITTDDPELAERARQLIDHGRTEGYMHEFVGYNYRMTNVAAAIGRDQLERLPDWTETRRDNADALTEGLRDSEVDTPLEPEGRRHVYHQYTVRVDDRDALTDALDAEEIGYGVYYPRTIPQQPAYDVDGEHPVAEDAAEEVVSLPVHPQVSEDAIRQIVEMTNRSTGDD